MHPDLFKPVEIVCHVRERAVTETRTLIQTIHRADSDGEETVVATTSDTTSPSETTTNTTDDIAAAGRWVWEYPTGEPVVVDGEETAVSGGVEFERTTTEETVTVHEERRLAMRFDFSAELAFGETINGTDPTIVSSHLRIESAEYRRPGFPSGEPYTQTVEATVFGFAVGDVMPADADEFDTLADDVYLSDSTIEHDDGPPLYVDVTNWLPTSDTADVVVLFEVVEDDTGMMIDDARVAIARVENPGGGDWHSNADSEYDWQRDWQWVSDGVVRYRSPLSYNSEVTLGGILPALFWRSTSHFVTLKLINPDDDSVIVSQTFTTTLVDTGEVDTSSGFPYPIFRFTIKSTGSWGNLVHFETTQFFGLYPPTEFGDYGISFRAEVIELVGGSFRDEDGIAMGYSQVPLWQETPPPTKAIAQIEFTADDQQFRAGKFTQLIHGSKKETCPGHCLSIQPHAVLQWNVDNLSIYGETVDDWQNANHSQCLFEIFSGTHTGIRGDFLSISGEHNLRKHYHNSEIARQPFGNIVYTKGALEQHGTITGTNCQGQTVLLRRPVEDAAAGDEGWAVLPNGGSIPRLPASKSFGPSAWDTGSMMYTIYTGSPRTPTASHPHDDAVSYGIAGNTIELSEGFVFDYQTLTIDDATFRIVGDVALTVHPRDLAFWETAALVDPAGFDANALDIVADGALINGVIGNGLIFELNDDKSDWVLIGQQTEGTHAETFNASEETELAAFLSKGDVGSKWYFKNNAGDHFTIDENGLVETAEPGDFVPTTFGGVIEAELEFKYLQGSEFDAVDAYDESGELDQDYLDCSTAFFDYPDGYTDTFASGIPPEVAEPAWKLPDEIEDHRNSGMAWPIYELPFITEEVIQLACNPGDPEPEYDYVESTSVANITNGQRPYYVTFSKVTETLTVEHNDGDYTVEQSLGVGTGEFHVMAGIVSETTSGTHVRRTSRIEMRTKTVDVALRMCRKIASAQWDALRSPDLLSLAFGSADVVGPDEQIFVLDGFTVTSERTTDFNNPSDPNPIERTVGNYTFAEYYQTGTIGGHGDRTIVEYCAKHRVDQLNNIALTISGRLAE